MGSSSKHDDGRPSSTKHVSSKKHQSTSKHHKHSSSPNHSHKPAPTPADSNKNKEPDAPSGANEQAEGSTSTTISHLWRCCQCHFAGMDASINDYCVNPIFCQHFRCSGCVWESVNRNNNGDPEPAPWIWNQETGQWDLEPEWAIGSEN